MGDQVQYCAVPGATRSIGAPRVRWPFLVAASDLAIIAAVALLNRGLPSTTLGVFAVVLPALLVVDGIYAGRSQVDMLEKLPATVWAVTVALMAAISSDFMVFHRQPDSAALLWMWLETVAALPTSRIGVASLHRSMARSLPRRRVLIVGSGTASVLAADKISRHPELGYEVVGFVDDGPRRSVRGRPEPLLGGLSDLSPLIGTTGSEIVIFGYTHHATPEMIQALYESAPRVEVMIMPRYFQFVSTGMKVEGLAGMPVLRLGRPQLASWERALKRVEDLVIGGMAALALLPIAPLIAIAIKLDSPGPVFFVHDRIGRNGRPFKMYKFRSMTEGASRDDHGLAALAHEDARGLKNKGDVRVTRVGSFLRKASLDELPQILNVLKGDMSLVGPRPPVMAEVAAYDRWQKKRLTVAPGITGMWQVSGRSDVPFDERIWLDFMYIDSWSLWLDLTILLKTVPAVLSAKGAY